MTFTSGNDSASIFKDEKLRSGIYKILNIVGQTYVDIREHTNGLCGRPATALEGKGLWEILPSGPGYTIRRLEPGKPEQFCNMVDGLGNRSVVSVAAFPAAWRIEMASEREYRGRDYIRVFWGATNKSWNLDDYGCDKDHTRVFLWDNSEPKLWEVWKLIPVKLDAGSQPITEATLAQTQGLGTLPPYNGSPANQRCTCSHQSTETCGDGFETTMVEVTTTTVTTRKKYRRVGGE